MKIKFSLKLSLLLFFTILPCIASLSTDVLENTKIKAGMEYLTTEHSTRRDAFIDNPAETSHESVNTTNIITLLSDKTKVSKIEATEDQKRTIATSVMATVFIHNGEKRLNRNHLKETDVLYRHFRALELIEDLSVLLTQRLTESDGLKKVNYSHLSQIWDNFSDLHTYSKITKDLFELWFNEALAAHNGGFVKLAAITKAKNSDLVADAHKTENLSSTATQNTSHVRTGSINEHDATEQILAESNGFSTPKKRLSFGDALPTTPSTRRKTELKRGNAPYKNGEDLSSTINGAALQFKYYRVSDDSDSANDENYLGLHINKHAFEARIQSANRQELESIYQQMMLEIQDTEQPDVKVSTENIIEAFANYYLGTGQLKMASTVLTGTPLCVWGHENEILTLQSIFLNGTILSDNSVITSIHERIKKLDESLIHLYHTRDDFYDSLELVIKGRKKEESQINVRTSFFSNPLQLATATTLGLTTVFAVVFQRYAPEIFSNIFTLGVKFLPRVFRGFLGGKR